MKGQLTQPGRSCSSIAMQPTPASLCISTAPWGKRLFPSLMSGRLQRFGFPTKYSTPTKILERGSGEYTLLSHLPQVQHLYFSKTLHLTHPVTPSQENTSHCSGDQGRRRSPEIQVGEKPCIRSRRPPDTSSITATKDSPGGPWGSAQLSQHPTPASQASCCRLQTLCPLSPRALAHMFAHASTEREGKPGCRNNTGTQTKEHKPLIWVNQRK